MSLFIGINLDFVLVFTATKNNLPREARAARLSVNPAAHGRRGSCSTGRLRASLHRCGKAPALCFAFARVLRQLSVYHTAELYRAVSL